MAGTRISDADLGTANLTDVVPVGIGSGRTGRLLSAIRTLFKSLYDATPSLASTEAPTSGGVYTALLAKDERATTIKLITDADYTLLASDFTDTKLEIWMSSSSSHTVIIPQGLSISEAKIKSVGVRRIGAGAVTITTSGSPTPTVTFTSGSNTLADQLAYCSINYQGTADTYSADNGLPPATILDSQISFSDITTNNVTSTKHGYTPKSPADATKFLNGAATPAFAAVKDSDLSTTDITTNDVTSSKHGFAPKSPGDTTKFLRGDATPSWAVPPGAVYSTTVLVADVTNNNGTPDTLADVTGLSFAGLSGHKYFFKFHITYTAAVAGTGGGFSVNCANAPTQLEFEQRNGVTATAEVGRFGLNARDAHTVSTATPATLICHATMFGVWQPSANDTLIARFSSEIASSAIVAKQDFSFVEYREIS